MFLSKQGKCTLENVLMEFINIYNKQDDFVRILFDTRPILFLTVVEKCSFFMK